MEAAESCRKTFYFFSTYTHTYPPHPTPPAPITPPFSHLSNTELALAVLSFYGADINCDKLAFTKTELLLSCRPDLGPEGLSASELKCF